MAIRRQNTPPKVARIPKGQSKAPAPRKAISAAAMVKTLLKYAETSAPRKYASPALYRNLGTYLSVLSSRRRLKIAIVTASPATSDSLQATLHLLSSALEHAHFCVASPDIERSPSHSACTFHTVQPGDQTALTQWADAEGPFDLVVDDGSLKGPQSLATLFVLFHRIREGGYYLLEDVQTSYWPQFGGSSLTPELFDTPMHWVKLFCDMVQRNDLLNENTLAARTGFEIASVHVHPRQCFIERGPVPPGLDQDTRQHGLGLERIKARELEALCNRLALDAEFRLRSYQLLDLLQKISHASA